MKMIPLVTRQYYWHLYYYVHVYPKHRSEWNINETGRGHGSNILYSLAGDGERFVVGLFVSKLKGF